MEPIKAKIKKLGILGGAFTGLGGLGAFGVCHTVCQAIIVGLAAVGITIIGMPLAFLQEPWFIAASFSIGFIFLGISYFVYLKHKAMRMVPGQEHYSKSVGKQPSEGHDCCHVD